MALHAISTEQGVEVISQQIVAGSVAASITFSSIPGTFEHLRVVLLGRGDTAAQGVLVQLRLNGDTGSNYTDQRDFGSAGSTGAAGSSAATSGTIGEIAAASATADRPGLVDISLPYYTRTTFDKVCQAMSADTSTLLVTLNAFVHWDNTAAVTSLTLLPASGNFIVGTIATLYGMS